MSKERSMETKSENEKHNNTIEDKELSKNVQKLEEEISNKKKLAKDNLEKINKKMFENLLISGIIMTFLLLIILGSLNIETTIFITDLKVFSIFLIVITIFLFEYSYRKQNRNICVHGIECLALAIFILLSTCLYTMFFKDFQLIVAFALMVCGIYYVLKSILVYIKMKKKYSSKINDINEIIKK